MGRRVLNFARSALSDTGIWEMINVPPGHFSSRRPRGHLSLPRNYIRHATTSESDESRTPDLSGGCLRHVLLWCVQYFRRSSLLARHTDGFVFSILSISPGTFLGHIKLRVSSKIDYMKHTTSDHDDRRLPDFSGSCLSHVLLCVH